jgi:hypothetical protein
VHEAPAIVEQIHDWALSTPVLPESGLGKAIKYMLGRWEGLIRFLDDPRIPLDNNATERELRNVVIGRKNHYGSRSQRGLIAASVLYSLIDTAILEGLNPREYLGLAVHRGLLGLPIPLPHEVAAELRRLAAFHAGVASALGRIFIECIALEQKRAAGIAESQSAAIRSLFASWSTIQPLALRSVGFQAFVKAARSSDAWKAAHMRPGVWGR